MKKLPGHIYVMIGLTCSILSGGLLFAGIYLFILSIHHLSQTLGFLLLILSLVGVVMGTALCYELGYRLTKSYKGELHV